MIAIMDEVSISGIGVIAQEVGVNKSCAFCCLIISYYRKAIMNRTIHQGGLGIIFYLNNDETSDTTVGV